jgi:hypothetical protein
VGDGDADGGVGDGDARGDGGGGGAGVSGRPGGGGAAWPGASTAGRGAASTWSHWVPHSCGARRLSHETEAGEGGWCHHRSSGAAALGHLRLGCLQAAFGHLINVKVGVEYCLDVECSAGTPSTCIQAQETAH